MFIYLQNIFNICAKVVFAINVSISTNSSIFYILLENYFENCFFSHSWHFPGEKYSHNISYF